MFERIYTPAETSQTLAIGQSTLRKWCIHLKNAGYVFNENAQAYRVFTDYDIKALEYMKELLNNKLTYEEASAEVMKSYSARTESVHGERDVLLEMMSKFDALIEYNKALTERLDEQQRTNTDLVTRLENQMDRRDQMLMATLKQIQENTILQLAAASEESTKKQKWRFWSR